MPNNYYSSIKIFRWLILLLKKQFRDVFCIKISKIKMAPGLFPINSTTFFETQIMWFVRVQHDIKGTNPLLRPKAAHPELWLDLFVSWINLYNDLLNQLMAPFVKGDILVSFWSCFLTFFRYFGKSIKIVNHKRQSLWETNRLGSCSCSNIIYFFWVPQTHFPIWHHSHIITLDHLHCDWIYVAFWSILMHF